MTTNLAQLLITKAAERPTLTLRTADEQVDLAHAIRQAAAGPAFTHRQGLRAEDRIAIVASNSTDFIVVWMACVLAGVPVALINPTYPPELLNQMLATFGPALLFTDLDHEVFTEVPLVISPSVRGEW